MRTKILMITALLVVIVAMTGMAVAAPFNLTIIGSDNPIQLTPGESITLDLVGTNFDATDIASGTMFPLSVTKSCTTSGCDASNVVISFTSPNFGPAASGTVTNAGILTISLNPNSSINTQYNIQIHAGSALTNGAIAEIGVTSVDDPVLWVVPDNPTKYISTSPNPLLSETVVENASMGTMFSGNVIVLNQDSYTKNGQHVDALGVHLKFFVADSTSASNIDYIQIGTAQRIKPGTPPTITDPNLNSNTAIATLNFAPVAQNSPIPAGFGVDYNIGDIPFSGGPSLTGDPQVNLNSFNPNNAYYYIKVPFTVHFKAAPQPGFVLYAYAENSLTNKLWAHTAYSHDGGFLNQIPEFPIVALPVASALVILFMFQRRKKKV